MSVVVMLFLGIGACSHLNTNSTADSINLTDENKLTEASEDLTSSGILHQQRIDDALLYYQMSQDLCEENRLDEAITALDQSYESILGIIADEDPEIMQQKEDLRRLISRRILEIYASRTNTLNLGGNGAIPLLMNPYVEKEIKLFQTKERTFFIESYGRSGKYRDYIENEFVNAGLPKEISWLPLIESGYKDKALSRARALGPWQFISSTGYRFNLKRDQWIDERMDFQRSTQAAIEYLTALHGLFGDWTTALAAYNCGEGNVLRAIRQQRVNYMDNFWDLYPMLPSETARYVPRFLATLHIVNDPEKYGFEELTADPPLEFDEVKTNKQMKLSDIAKALSVDAKTLEGMNPALRHKVTPDYTYTLRVPKDTSEILLASLDEIPRCTVTVQTYTRHRVRKGETLSQIARKYRTSVRTIARLNGIRNVSRIRIGQRLKVPLRYPLTTFSSKEGSASGDYLQYRVQRGDTLWSIAQKYNTSVKTIKSINRLSSNTLHTGQMLQVPKG
jgi:membrane-bound lytic murein transglycosylase D